MINANLCSGKVIAQLQQHQVGINRDLSCYCVSLVTFPLRAFGILAGDTVCK